MPKSNDLSAYILSLLIVWLGWPQKVIVDGDQLDDAFVKYTLEGSVADLVGSDQKLFMKKCAWAQQQLCDPGVVGENGTFHFKTSNGSKETKDRFWAAYTCYMTKKVPLCPVDGEWTTWSEWSGCSAKCGDLAEVHRLRHCQNPAPMNSGRPCRGPVQQDRLCQGSCGPNDKDEGREEALRFTEKIHIVFPSLKTTCFHSHCSYEELGKYINKTDIKNKYWASLHCYKYERACPVDGHWSAWSGWSSCSPTCGNGYKHRKRECNNPTPKDGGYKCLGDMYEEKTCVGYDCKLQDFDRYSPILSEWSMFEPCSKKCGSYGTSKMTRKCLNAEECVSNEIFDVNMTHTKPCYDGPCFDVVGSWSAWSEYSKLSSWCGPGRIMRFRICNQDQQIDGAVCEGKSVERIQKEGQCSDEDLAWFENRRNEILKKTKGTNDHPPKDELKIEPLDPETEELYTQWSSWTKCPKQCMTGIRERFRECKLKDNINNNNNQIDHGTTTSTPVKTKSDVSNYSRNPEDTQTDDLTETSNSENVLPDEVSGISNPDSIQMNDMTESSMPDNVQGDDMTETSIPDNIQADDVAESSIPDNVQGNDVMESSITDNIQADDLMETNSLVSHYLRMKRQGDQSEELSDETESNHLSDNGNTAIKSVMRCNGELWQNQPCNMNNCPVSGGWSEWEAWNTCSTTCGKGERTRYRRCNQPLPKFGGTCFGYNKETVDCEGRACGERISYSKWSDWSNCNQTCGIGSKTKTRTCIIPDGVNPDDVSHHCSEQYIKAQSICNVFPCPINGAWGNWNSWLSCSAKCGLGEHFRDRTCTYPAPKYNGKSCYGIGSDVMPCFKIPCEVMKQHFLKLDDGKIFYNKRGYPIGYFSLFVQFNSRKSNQLLLRHTYDSCKTEADCHHSVQIDIDSNHLVVTIKLKTQSEPITLKTEDNSIQKDKWHNVYLHLAEKRAFIRLDDYKKYERKLEWDTRDKIDFDGYTKIGPFTGKIASLRINLIEFELRNWPRPAHMYPHLIENGVYHNNISDPEDAVIGYTIFNGHTFIKIPLDANAYNITAELTLLPTKDNGLLLFNTGATGGSYFYLALKEGSLVFCVANSKTHKCESIMNPMMYQWCKIEVIVSDKHAAVSVNRANAIQMSLPEEGYQPAAYVLVGGGEKSDEFMYDLITGIIEGFHGIIHDINLNGKLYRVDANPVMNDQGELSSLGINSPGKATEVYEHRDSNVEFRCDYTGYDNGVNTRIEWFKEDQLLPIHAKIKVPGLNSIGELDLKPSPNQTGLYSCAVKKDGMYTVLHAYFLIRHDVKVENYVQEEEKMGITVFLIVISLLLVGCVFFLGTHRLKAIHKKELEEVKKGILSQMEGSPKAEGKGLKVRIAIDESYDTEGLSMMESEMEGTDVLESGTEGTEGMFTSGTEGIDTSLAEESSKAPTRETSAENTQMEDIPEVPEESYSVQDIQKTLGSASNLATKTSRSRSGDSIKKTSLEAVLPTTRPSEVMGSQDRKSSKESVASYKMSGQLAMSSPELSRLHSATVPRSGSKLPPGPSSQTLPRPSSQTRSSSQTLPRPSSQTLPPAPSHTYPSSKALLQQSSQTLPRPSSQSLPRPQSETLPKTLYQGLSSSTIPPPPKGGQSSIQSMRRASSVRSQAMSHQPQSLPGSQMMYAPRQRLDFDPQTQGSVIGPPLSTSSRMSTPILQPDQQAHRQMSRGISRTGRGSSSERLEMAQRGSSGKQLYRPSMPSTQRMSRSTINSLSQHSSEVSDNVLYVSRNEYQPDDNLSLVNRSGYEDSRAVPGYGGRHEYENSKENVLYISRQEYEDDDHNNVGYISKHKYTDHDLEYVSRSIYGTKTSPTRILPSEKKSPTKGLTPERGLYEATANVDMGLPPPPPPPNWMFASRDPSFSGPPSKPGNQIALPPTGSPSPTKKQIPDSRYRSPTRTLPSPEKQHESREQRSSVIDAKSDDSDGKISIHSLSSIIPKSPNILDPNKEFQKSMKALATRRINLDSTDTDSG